MQDLIGSRVILLTRDFFDSDDEEEIHLFPGATGTIDSVNHVDNETGEINLNIWWDAGGSTVYSEREIGRHLRLEGAEILGLALTIHPDQFVSSYGRMALASPSEFMAKCKSISPKLMIYTRSTTHLTTGQSLAGLFTKLYDRRRMQRWLLSHAVIHNRDGVLRLGFTLDNELQAVRVPFQRLLRRIVEDDYGDG